MNTKIKQTLQSSIITILILLLLIFIVKFSFIANYFFGNAQNPKGELITLFIQLLGGSAIIGTLWFSIKRLKILEEANNLSNRQFHLAEKGNITDRFSRSVDQLGSENDALRLGGIYALNQIAKEDANYQESICEILCAFIRSESSKIGEVKFKREDFQAIMNLFSTQNPIFSNCYKELSGGKFYDIIFNNCSFQSSGFTDAIFNNAKIENSDFSNSIMKNTSFINSEIKNSNFSNAIIEKSSFKTCKFLGIDTQNSNLNKSKFNDVDIRDSFLNHSAMNNIEWNGGNIIRSILDECNLNNSIINCDFENCNLLNLRCNRATFSLRTFKDCNFSGSDLYESNFKYTKHFRSNFTKSNLRSTNFNSAYFDKTTFSNARNIDKYNFENITLIDTDLSK